MHKNTMITGAIVALLAGVVAVSNIDKVTNAIKQMKKDKNAENAQDVNIDTFDSAVLEDFSQSLQERKSTEDWIMNLETLYARDKDLDLHRTITVTPSGAEGEVSYTIENVSYTKNREELHEDPNALGKLEENPMFFDEDGNLKKEWTFVCIETLIQNTGDSVIPMFYQYGYIMSVEGYSNEGNLGYASSGVIYHSYQPGDSEQHALYQKDFAPGDSFENTYVIAVPDVVLDSLHTAVVVNGTADADFLTDSCYLMNLK